MINRIKLVAVYCVLLCGISGLTNTADAQSDFENVAASKDIYRLSELIDLNENNWDAMLTGEWMVEFFAPWCPACKSLAPTWKQFAVSAGHLGVHVGKVDVTTSPSLSGRFLVTALPTIYHVKNGIFRQYRGSRDEDAFKFFVKQRQWEKIDPISNWKQPDSMQMSILSHLFKLSHILKEYNNRLYEDYGIPSWGCYALFTVATIFLSASLGLILICVIDLFYPPKKAHRESFSESKGKIEEIPNDEIEDDAEQDDIEEEEDDNEEENNDSTSESEKNSGSDNDEEDENEVEDKVEKIKGGKKEKDTSAAAATEELDSEKKPSPTEVRKRKPRKADF